ncbi:MAG: hypothetical protein FJ267_07380 [Planctomycetes bacterium]|nr:hypothetical protein [Planctomycetota bacterium]
MNSWEPVRLKTLEAFTASKISFDALANPMHEQDDDFIERGGDFNPKEFDVGKGTWAIKKGLPDWRELTEETKSRLCMEVDEGS